MSLFNLIPARCAGSIITRVSTSYDADTRTRLPVRLFARLMTNRSYHGERGGGRARTDAPNLDQTFEWIWARAAALMKGVVANGKTWRNCMNEGLLMKKRLTVHERLDTAEF